MADFNLVQAVFDRTASAPAEDVAVITMHIRQVIQLSPDILPVTDQGRDDFVGDFTDFWVAVSPYISSQIKLRELRFYDVPATRGQHMGDPVKIQPFEQPGGSNSPLLPPQVAASVTFKTAHRKRWGRFYMPGMTTASSDAKGRIAVDTRVALANGAHALTDRSGTGAALVVFSRMHWSHEDPETIQVDDLFDVVRRRRYSVANARTSLPAA